LSSNSASITARFTTSTSSAIPTDFGYSIQVVSGNPFKISLKGEMNYTANMVIDKVISAVPNTYYIQYYWELAGYGIKWSPEITYKSSWGTSSYRDKNNLPGYKPVSYKSYINYNPLVSVGVDALGITNSSNEVSLLPTYLYNRNIWIDYSGSTYFVMSNNYSITPVAYEREWIFPSTKYLYIRWDSTFINQTSGEVYKKTYATNYARYVILANDTKIRLQTRVNTFSPWDSACTIYASSKQGNFVNSTTTNNKWTFDMTDFFTETTFNFVQVGGSAITVIQGLQNGQAYPADAIGTPTLKVTITERV
jgi:hypothetical protein